MCQKSTKSEIGAANFAYFCLTSYIQLKSKSSPSKSRSNPKAISPSTLLDQNKSDRAKEYYFQVELNQLITKNEMLEIENQSLVNSLLQYWSLLNRLYDKAKQKENLK